MHTGAPVKDDNVMMHVNISIDQIDFFVCS